MPAARLRLGWGRAALRVLLTLAALISLASPSMAQEALSEYRLKAGVLYNFATFTEWPAGVGPTINLCIYGADPFDDALDELQGKPVGRRSIALQRKTALDALKGCQVVFVSAQGMRSFARVMDELRQLPVLTVADSPGAARQGAMLNMLVSQGKVSFEANLESARAARLVLSSRLLRLAVEVYQ
jgi:hypothetical protein